MGVGVGGSGFEIWDLGCGAWGQGFVVSWMGVGVGGSGFRVWGLECGASRFGFRVWGQRCMVEGQVLRIQIFLHSSSRHATLFEYFPSTQFMTKAWIGV